jgi:hypothetical protein
MLRTYRALIAVHAVTSVVSPGVCHDPALRWRHTYTICRMIMEDKII